MTASADAGADSCVNGCHSDADCALRLSCQNGQCANSCTSNDFCATGQFCDSETQPGQCQPSAVNYCLNPTGCDQCPCDCSANAGTCLETLIEGQITPWCAQTCTFQTDCPSEFNCTPTVEACCQQPTGATTDQCTEFEGSTAACALAAAPGTYCHGWNTVDESLPQYLCTDPTTNQPYQGQAFCAPVTGFCAE